MLTLQSYAKTTASDAFSRYTHRSASYSYLELWKNRKVDYAQALDRPYMFQSPQLVERILRVESAMKVRGLVPFVHAMPAATMVHMQFADALYGNTNRFFKYLRPKTKEMAVTWEEAVQAIPREVQKCQKPHLLSVSYALSSGIRPLESTAAWGFINHNGKDQNLDLTWGLHALMKSVGFQSACHTRQAELLIRRFSRLRVGNFILLGVPQETVCRWMYDSVPYNVPTGHSVARVAARPASFADTLFQEGCHMATMLICDETLDPDAGLVVVLANDEDAVTDYVQGETFKPMHEVDLYRELFTERETEFERAEVCERNKLVSSLESLTSDMKKVLDGFSDDDLVIHITEDALSGFDIPVQLP